MCLTLSRDMSVDVCGYYEEWTWSIARHLFAAEKFCVTLCRVAKVKLPSLKRQPGFITIDLIPHELLPALAAINKCIQKLW